ncbi:MAG: transcriptional repressor [Clostridiales bacterium]|nr:transcriptional repressor [Clostridiales bacterium]
MTDSLWPSGIKKTKQREAVFEILEHADAPLSAMDIFERIDKEGTPVWLSTVYRTLDLFTEKGITLKTTVLHSDMAYYERNRDIHRHFAVCVDCHKRVAINSCPLADYQPKLPEDEFRVLGHRVEMYGYCKDCDRQNNKESRGGKNDAGNKRVQ